jgi:hypothetical protein
VLLPLLVIRWITSPYTFFWIPSGLYPALGHQKRLFSLFGKFLSSPGYCTSYTSSLASKLCALHPPASIHLPITFSPPSETQNPIFPKFRLHLVLSWEICCWDKEYLGLSESLLIPSTSYHPFLGFPLSPHSTKPRSLYPAPLLVKNKVWRDKLASTRAILILHHHYYLSCPAPTPLSCYLPW